MNLNKWLIAILLFFLVIWGGLFYYQTHANPTSVDTNSSPGKGTLLNDTEGYVDWQNVPSITSAACVKESANISESELASNNANLLAMLKKSESLPDQDYISTLVPIVPAPGVKNDGSLGKCRVGYLGTAGKGTIAYQSLKDGIVRIKVRNFPAPVTTP